MDPKGNNQGSKEGSEDLTGDTGRGSKQKQESRDHAKEPRGEQESRDHTNRVTGELVSTIDILDIEAERARLLAAAGSSTGGERSHNQEGGGALEGSYDIAVGEDGSVTVTPRDADDGRSKPTAGGGRRAWASAGNGGNKHQREEREGGSAEKKARRSKKSQQLPSKLISLYFLSISFSCCIYHAYINIVT